MKFKEIWKAYNKVFDIKTLETLNELYYNKYIGEELIVISEGKEAIVFKSDNKAVKIYKLSEKFRDKINYIKMDNRFKSFPKTKIGVLYLWVKKEYINLNRMYKKLINVPIPYIYKNNILVMSFIGDQRSILLHDIIHRIEDKENIFFQILDQYKKIYLKAKLVHGDFSEYNMIYYNNKIYVIDVSQAIPNSSPYADIFLEKDINNIYNISLKFKLNYDKEFIYKYITES